MTLLQDMYKCDFFITLYSYIVIMSGGATVVFQRRPDPPGHQDVSFQTSITSHRTKLSTSSFFTNSGTLIGSRLCTAVWPSLKFFFVNFSNLKPFSVATYCFSSAMSTSVVSAMASGPVIPILALNASVKSSSSFWS